MCACLCSSVSCVLDFNFFWHLAKRLSFIPSPTSFLFSHHDHCNHDDDDEGNDEKENFTYLCVPLLENCFATIGHKKFLFLFISLKSHLEDRWGWWWWFDEKLLNPVCDVQHTENGDEEDLRSDVNVSYKNSYNLAIELQTWVLQIPNNEHTNDTKK